MPDPNLRRAVREALELPDEISLTQAEMLGLTRFDAYQKEITDLTGIEYANNLTWLSFAENQIRDLSTLAELFKLEILYLWGNPISDISPLANLVDLKALDLGGCRVSDIRPLANLRHLESLRLHYNQIADITPLTSLKNLTELWLTANQIVDISPLKNLTALEELRIQNNRITDHSLLDTLTLAHLEYDEVCDILSFPVSDRIDGRKFPSVFTAWGGLGWSSVINLPESTDLEQMALHDLYFCCLIFNQSFMDTEDGAVVVGDMTYATQLRDAYLDKNPNMLFLAGLSLRSEQIPVRGLDWEFFIRDENGDLITAFGDKGNAFMDFTHPEVQRIIINQAVAVAKCGLYDGIFFDWWTEDSVILADGVNATWGVSEDSGFRGFQAEQDAKDNILKGIRSQVRDNFLILVNSNRRKFPRTAWAINGTFMETLRDHEGGYTYAGLQEIESTLRWAESNLREPRINAVEGWGVPSQPPDGDVNRKWMRVFTAMTLTHSDGYVLYNIGYTPATGGNDHQHIWYDFWDADLGRPIGEKAELYKTPNTTPIEGLFIREFTNGWAVYNRSGKERLIQLPEEVSGVESSLENKRWHTIPDLDGEIYLKSGFQTSPTVDVNGDGTVNVLDLVAVANAFGKDTPDVNGDGVVNVLDLVAVANQFGQ